SAENARRLIDDILQLARHQEPVAQHPLNVEPLLREILSTLQPTFPERIHLTLSCASPLPSVQIDPSQFQRAIVNLLLNARDAIEGEGTIAIEAAAHDLNTAVDGLERTLFPGRYLAITITDSGAGISPEIMERVFEPFFTTKAAGQGSGIGLSSAYGIIVRAGGFMRLTSEPGKGSEFQIFLPVPPSAMA
ncbi:MAG: hypothetical protein RL648_273, partial [Verrucomicrobiota bacterium]